MKNVRCKALKSCRKSLFAQPFWVTGNVGAMFSCRLRASSLSCRNEVVAG